MVKNGGKAWAKGREKMSREELQADNVFDGQQRDIDICSVASSGSLHSPGFKFGKWKNDRTFSGLVEHCATIRFYRVLDEEWAVLCGNAWPTHRHSRPGSILPKLGRSDASR